MHVPDELRYTRSHEWVRREGDAVTVGITDHAQHELGDVVYVELPQVGQAIGVGDVFGTVESVKAVSDLYSPVEGEVIEVNESLNDRTEAVNEDPYGEGWLIRVRLTGTGGGDHLLGPEQYGAFLQEAGQ